MNEISAATFCLIEAVEIARTKISEKAADNLVSDYETYLREQIISSPATESTERGIQNYSRPTSGKISDEEALNNNIELVLPSPLSNFEDIQAIWINNSHLEEIGIMKNSLAVIVSTDDIKRGDLVAVEEKENQNVSCGF